MKVLSLFDGMSCGRLALERVGIKVDEYFASEIDKNSIKVTQTNFPNTIQLGSVTNLDIDYLKTLNIDLLIGGFPCRNLSRTVINNYDHNQGLEGEHSQLFYNLLHILKELKPRYFLVENVESMKLEDKDIISELLEVEPYMINSSLVSAQNRKRYYWTNIPFDNKIADKGLLLKDIVLPSELVDEKYWYKQDYEFLGNDKTPVAILDINGHDILKRVYGLHQKCPTLTSCRGGNKQKKVLQNNKARKLTPIEYERLQTVPDNYTGCVADTHRYNMLGDGWTVDVVSHIFKGLK